MRIKIVINNILRKYDSIFVKHGANVRGEQLPVKIALRKSGGEIDTKIKSKVLLKK